MVKQCEKNIPDSYREEEFYVLLTAFGEPAEVDVVMLVLVILDQQENLDQTKHGKTR